VTVFRPSILFLLLLVAIGTAVCQLPPSQAVGKALSLDRTAVDEHVAVTMPSRLLWDKQIGEASDVWSVPIIDEASGVVVCVVRDSPEAEAATFSLAGVSPAGKLLWKFPLPQCKDAALPAEVEPGLYAIVCDQSVALLDSVQGVRWSVPLPADSSVFCKPLIAGSQIIIHCGIADTAEESSTSITCLNLSGSIEWNIAVDAASACREGLLANDGAIYYGLSDYQLAAISPAGKLKWIARCDPAEYPVEGQRITVPLSAAQYDDIADVWGWGGMSVLPSVELSNGLIALCAMTGEIALVDRQGVVIRQLETMPAVGALLAMPEESFLLVLHGYVLRVSLDGDVIWRRRISPNHLDGPQVVAANGRIISRDGTKFRCLDNDGNTLWTFSARRIPADERRAFVLSDKVSYGLSSVGTLCAIDTSMH